MLTRPTLLGPARRALGVADGEQVAVVREGEPAWPSGTDRDFQPLILRVDALVRGDAVVRAKLDAVAALVVRMVPDCDSASISVVLAGETTTAAISDHVALEVDLLQYRYQEGPCLDAASDEGGGRGTVVRVDLIDDPRYRRFAPGAIDAGISTVLSLPLRAHAGNVIGSMNLYSTSAHAFGAPAERAAAPFAAYVSEVVEESFVLDAALELVRRATSVVEADALVNQAVGVLMGERGCTPEAALAALAATALTAGTDLRTAADAVLARRRTEPE